MKFSRKPLLAAAVSLSCWLATPVFAEVPADLGKKLEDKLGPFSSLSESPVAGWYELVDAQDRIFYVSADGEYLISGTLYKMDDQPVNLTQQRSEQLRSERIKPLMPKLEALASTAIVYKAAEEKYVVNVFTDVYCGYCQRFHSHMDEYNAAGITIRYFALPIIGRDQSIKDMTSVWCSENPAEALTEAKARAGKRQPIEEVTCDSQVVQEHLTLGREMGISGTPAILLNDGTLISGYLDPQALSARLAQLSQK